MLSLGLNSGLGLGLGLGLDSVFRFCSRFALLLMVCSHLVPPVDGGGGAVGCPIGSFCPNGYPGTVITCYVGYYCGPASYNPTPCPTGGICPYTGMTLFLSCPAGTYQPSQYGTSCLSCPDGTYSSSSGASVCTSCLSCLSGYYTSGCGVGPGVCSLCINNN